jgi:hypothetical protein
MQINIKLAKQLLGQKFKLILLQIQKHFGRVALGVPECFQANLIFGRNAMSLPV